MHAPGLNNVISKTLIEIKYDGFIVKTSTYFTRHQTDFKFISNNKNSIKYIFQSTWKEQKERKEGKKRKKEKKERT